MPFVEASPGADRRKSGDDPRGQVSPCWSGFSILAGNRCRTRRRPTLDGARTEGEMIRDAEALRRFEDDLARGEKSDFARTLRLVDSLHREAVRFGVSPRKDPMDGIEVVLRIAKALNLVRKTAP